MSEYQFDMKAIDRQNANLFELVRQLRIRSDELHDAGDAKSADLFDNAADALEDVHADRMNYLEKLRAMEK